MRKIIFFAALLGAFAFITNAQSNNDFSTILLGIESNIDRTMDISGEASQKAGTAITIESFDPESASFKFIDFREQEIQIPISKIEKIEFKQFNSGGNQVIQMPTPTLISSPGQKYEYRIPFSKLNIKNNKLILPGADKYLHRPKPLSSLPRSNSLTSKLSVDGFSQSMEILEPIDIEAPGLIGAESPPAIDAEMPEPIDSKVTVLEPRSIHYIESEKIFVFLAQEVNYELLSPSSGGSGLSGTLKGQ